MADTASGAPSKHFFVEMLTRDISLNDAILDLLDNCLDGVLRLSGEKNKLEDSNFYNGYRASITISKEGFSIKDNCGGILRKDAEEYAFRMGKPSKKDGNIPTIGIYGIGMKRAIFKLGKEAVVHTRNADEKYSVKIPLDWVKNDSEWSFPIEDNSEDNTLDVNGTEVKILTLNSSLANFWGTASNLNSFIESLRIAIQESYSLIILKGFNIEINGKVVEAKPIKLLAQKGNEKTAIRPFVFSKQYGEVTVKMVIGFYAPMASDDEIDEMNESKRTSYDAGITVVCNDRIVLYNDKSSLTGWGVSGVPQYHTQFIGIKGIVRFDSNNPEALPMTTTKRGVDHSSAIYIAVKDRMCEGLKMFTNYTNQWKGRNEQEREYSRKAEKVDYQDLIADDEQKKYGISIKKLKKGDIYRPNLPKPDNDTPYRVIRFTKSINEIAELKRYFFKDSEANISASDVGKKCFEEVLKIATQGE